MTRLDGSDLDHLRLTIAPAQGEAMHVEVHGFLDYDSADHFLAVTTRHLTVNPRLRHLHLDCTALSGIDSMGLAMLLMLHRRTVAASVTLHLDNRTPALERILDITGTLDHLAPDRTVEKSAQHEAQDAGPAGGLHDAQCMAYRHTSKDGTPAGSTSAGSDAGD
ncbi:STAS domain-containing protein [Streptomyces sp. NBC_00728]|jgi:anti-anti-sigma factor|uniref:STAS domain-containing protein n=1 Tax=Streptomyces sp. NBC_00728 TaxID=2903676 RepID=UPI0038630F05